MAKFSQSNRPMRVDTALDTDVLMLEGFSGDEAVSSPYGYTLDLLSENATIAAADVLRTPMLVTVKTLDGSGERYIHGLVRSFAQLDQSEGLTSYRAEIVPWLWFLSLSTDCRIFQNLTVPDIVTQVFKDMGYSDYQLKLVKPHPKRVFCVQYRESHLNFVSRLLEEEGIFYFFEHTKGKHSLVLSDDNGAVKPCPVQSKARMATDIGQWQAEDVLTSWEHENAVHTGKVTLRDYDFEQPSLNLEASVAGQYPEEHYAYPGRYTTLDDGDRFARLQLEGEESRQHIVRAGGTCRTFQSGFRFDLKGHYRPDANQTYLLLEVRHSGRAGDYRSWESAPFDYRNSFTAIPYSVPYRPLRVTPKPRIWGTQTAMVVGKAGEEIWTDKQGRVKIQFYWDRLGKRNENSSCWVRVSQPWAGKGWGGLSIPRIGQEVVVEFLEGDPDFPLIVGRVYNAEQTPPYNPGAGGVVSGMRSKTHKGQGYNEMSMDDTAGREKITIHGQYDMGTRVEHDKAESIGNNETIDIGNDRTETVAGNETLTVAMDRTRTVSKNETVTVSLTRSHTVGINESINVGAAQEVTVGAYRSLSVGAYQNTDIGANLSMNVGKNHKLTIGSNRDVDVGQNDKLKIGKTLAIEAGDQITFKTGSASITMKKDGTITIEGKDITLKASGQATVKASSDLTLKGTNILQN
jgi:type VI secretion system secreted protein VgrG